MSTLSDLLIIHKTAYSIAKTIYEATGLGMTEAQAIKDRDFGAKLVPAVLTGVRKVLASNLTNLNRAPTHFLKHYINKAPTDAIAQGLQTALDTPGVTVTKFAGYLLVDWSSAILVEGRYTIDPFVFSGSGTTTPPP